ncbi:MAG: class I SAM-dependent methyltransferase [Bacteroidales bacterium]|nr:class I SAM-dependent methyltransferase [Bacteroidales bacterium]
MKKIRPKFQENVSETLLIPLCMRAKESQQKKPIIKDEMSEQILSKLDYDFNKFTADERCQLCISVRTNYFDNALKDFVAKYDDAVVVVVACGLDPRIERVAINKKYQTYQIDFPDVIKFRRKLLPESAENKYISGNITNEEWVKSIKENHPMGHFLFLVEGLSMYLKEEQVKQFFKTVDDNFSNAEIHIERVNKFLSKRTQDVISVNQTKAKFNWGCDNPLEIESWGNSFKFADEYYYYSVPKLSELRERLGKDAILYQTDPEFSRSIGIWKFVK